MEGTDRDRYFKAIELHTHARIKTVTTITGKQMGYAT